jgi:hypothetical protein
MYATLAGQVLVFKLGNQVEPTVPQIILLCALTGISWAGPVLKMIASLSKIHYTFGFPSLVNLRGQLPPRANPADHSRDSDSQLTRGTE